MQLSTPFPGAGSHRDFDWGLRGENVRKLMSRYDTVPQLDADTSGMVGEPGQIVATQRSITQETNQYIDHRPPGYKYRSTLLHGGPHLPRAESTGLSFTESPFQHPELKFDTRLRSEQYARGILEGDCADESRCVATQTGEGLFTVYPEPPRWTRTRRNEAANEVIRCNMRTRGPIPEDVSTFRPPAPRYFPPILHPDPAPENANPAFYRPSNLEYDGIQAILQAASDKVNNKKKYGRDFGVSPSRAYHLTGRAYGVLGPDWEGYKEACRDAHIVGFWRHEGKYGHLPFFVVNEGTQTDPPAADKSKKRKGSGGPADAKRLRANQAKIKPGLGKRTKRTKAKSK